MMNARGRWRGHDILGGYDRRCAVESRIDQLQSASRLERQARGL
jgi:hypothetical protein